jgi:hypothetical protein
VSGVDWTEKQLLTVPKVADVLACSSKQVYRLVDDWAFGDPAQLPRVGLGGGRTGLRIPVTALKAFLAGERGYPPGDPRGSGETVDGGCTR